MTRLFLPLVAASALSLLAALATLPTAASASSIELGQATYPTHRTLHRRWDTDDDTGDDSGSGSDGEDPSSSGQLKEFHFHVYFHPENPAEVQAAQSLHARITHLQRSHYFHAIPKPLTYHPDPPHPIGNYEVWTPIEQFGRVDEFFDVNRGNLSILMHPISREQGADHDHNRRARWKGPILPLITSVIREHLSYIPKQYPELHLGYSK